MSTNPNNYQDLVIEAYKLHIDRTLIRENFKLTVTERIKKLEELQEFAATIRGKATEILNIKSK